MPSHLPRVSCRQEIFVGYTVLSSDSKIRLTGAVHVTTTAFTSFPALSQTVGFASLTWTNPSDANRISEKSHVLGTCSEMGRARDRHHFIILFCPRRRCDGPQC